MGRAYDDPMLVTNEVIAKLVKAQRGRLGISLAALASASGVSCATLEALETRRGGCSAVDLWRVAQALEVPISDLCGPFRVALAPRSFATEETSDSDRGGASANSPFWSAETTEGEA